METVHATVAPSDFEVKMYGVGVLLEVQMLRKCTALRREAHVEVNVHSTKHLVVGALEEVELVKNERGRGAKHISKSKCSMHFRFRLLLDVELSKLSQKCGRQIGREKKRKRKRVRERGSEKERDRETEKKRDTDWERL